MTTIAIVTPWLNTPELIPDYERTVSKANQVIIIDNGSDPADARALVEMCERHAGWQCIRNDTNTGYSKANNQGLEAATTDAVVFLNSDVEGDPLWIERLRVFMHRGALFGASLQMRHVDKIGIPFLEGWCLAGYTDEIRKIGGWNDTDFPGLYYEDNEFCWRASRSGLSLQHVRLPLHHINNYTSKRTPGAYDKAQDNRLVFEGIVRRDRG